MLLWSTHEQVHDDAHAERIALGVYAEVRIVGVRVDDLRCHVAGSAAAFVEVLLHVHVGCQTEVAEFHVVWRYLSRVL